MLVSGSVYIIGEPWGTHLAEALVGFGHFAIPPPRHFGIFLFATSLFLRKFVESSKRPIQDAPLPVISGL